MGMRVKIVLRNDVAAQVLKHKWAFFCWEKQQASLEGRFQNMGKRGDLVKLTSVCGPKQTRYQAL